MPIGNPILFFLYIFQEFFWKEMDHMKEIVVVILVSLKAKEIFNPNDQSYINCPNLAFMGQKIRSLSKIRVFRLPNSLKS